MTGIPYADARDGLLQFIADGTNPEVDTIKVVNITVSAAVEGEEVTGTGEAIVKAFLTKCAAIQFTPETIAPGDTAKLTFRPLDGEPFPEGQQFDVFLMSDEGILLSLDGSLAKQLKGISDSAFYIAPDSLETDSIVVRMRAQTAPPKPGGPVIVASVAMASNGGETERAAIEPPNVCNLSGVTVKGNIELDLTVVQAETLPEGFVNVQVLATKNGKATSGVDIRLIARGIESSGGHAHIGNRPAGQFIVSAGQTSDNGIYSTLYIASIIAGYDKIFVTSTATSEMDSVELHVRIPNLVPLLQESPHLLTLHTSDEVDQNHSVQNSNYGLQTVIVGIVSVIAQYSNELELDNETFIGSIDMSLPSGGLFDINGNWAPPHELHRKGSSVDFTHFYRDRQRNLRSVTISVDGQPLRTTSRLNEDRLDFWFDYYGFDRYEKSTDESKCKIHYERRF